MTNRKNSNVVDADGAPVEETAAVATMEAPGALSPYVEAIGDPMVAEILRENLGGDTFDPMALPRVSIPSGGGIAWTVPTLDGDLDSVRSIDGVIVHWATWRAFWPETFDQSGGGNPPTCTSRDGVVGVGDPGVECAKCPFNAWGSAPSANGGESRGKACKEMRALFVLPEGSVLPYIILAPPMSLSPMRSYFLGLAAKRTPYHGVVTSLGLEQTQNRAGIRFSRIAPRTARVLSDDERAAFASYREALRPAIEGIMVGEIVEQAAGDDLPFE